MYTMYYSWSLLPNDGCDDAVWRKDQPHFILYTSLSQEQQARAVWEGLRFLAHPRPQASRSSACPGCPGGAVRQSSMGLLTAHTRITLLPEGCWLVGWPDQASQGPDPEALSQHSMVPL